MKNRGVYLYKYVRAMAAMFLLLFVAYYVNITLFIHYHVVDGVTIVHSHICSEDHAQQSGDEAHSSTELTLIAAISNFIACEQEFSFDISAASTVVESLYESAAERTIYTQSFAIPQLRAPPMAA